VVLAMNVDLVEKYEDDMIALGWSDLRVEDSDTWQQIVIFMMS